MDKKLIVLYDRAFEVRRGDTARGVKMILETITNYDPFTAYGNPREYIVISYSSQDGGEKKDITVKSANRATMQKSLSDILQSDLYKPNYAAIPDTVLIVVGDIADREKCKEMFAMNDLPLIASADKYAINLGDEKSHHILADFIGADPVDCTPEKFEEAYDALLLSIDQKDEEIIKAQIRRCETQN